MNRRSFISSFAAVLSGAALVRAIPAEAAPDVLGSHSGVKLSVESIRKLGFDVVRNGRVDVSDLILPPDRVDMIKLMLPIAGLFPAIPQWDVWWDTGDHENARADRAMYDRLTEREKASRGPYKYRPITYGGHVPTALFGQLESTQVTIRAIPGHVYNCEIVQFSSLADPYGRRAMEPMRADLSPTSADPEAPPAVVQVGDRLAALREELACLLIEALDVLSIQHRSRR